MPGYRDDLFRVPEPVPLEVFPVLDQGSQGTTALGTANCVMQLQGPFRREMSVIGADPNHTKRGLVQDSLYFTLPAPFPPIGFFLINGLA